MLNLFSARAEASDKMLSLASDFQANHNTASRLNQLLVIPPWALHKTSVKNGERECVMKSGG